MNEAESRRSRPYARSPRCSISRREEFQRAPASRRAPWPASPSEPQNGGRGFFREIAIYDLIKDDPQHDGMRHPADFARPACGDGATDTVICPSTAMFKSFFKHAAGGDAECRVWAPLRAAARRGSRLPSIVTITITHPDGRVLHADGVRFR